MSAWEGQMARLCRHLDFLESFLKNDRDHVKHLRSHKIEWGTWQNILSNPTKETAETCWNSGPGWHAFSRKMLGKHSLSHTNWVCVFALSLKFYAILGKELKSSMLSCLLKFFGCILFYVYECILPACMYLHHVCTWGSWRPEELQLWTWLRITVCWKWSLVLWKILILQPHVLASPLEICT